MGENFSGSWSVASRNPLIHNGATNATKWRRSDSEEAPPCRTRVLGAELDRSLATLNFRESLKAKFGSSLRTGPNGPDRRRRTVPTIGVLSAGKAGALGGGLMASDRLGAKAAPSGIEKGGGAALLL